MGRRKRLANSKCAGPGWRRLSTTRRRQAIAGRADGWFRTGDVADIDAEGYIKLVDRSKDLIKSGGEWISSVDLENALMCHPGVREAAVIGVPHPKWQERPLAVVVAEEGHRRSGRTICGPFWRRNSRNGNCPMLLFSQTRFRGLPWANS